MAVSQITFSIQFIYRFYVIWCQYLYLGFALFNLKH
jgi:hypothetical protein